MFTKPYMFVDLKMPLGFHQTDGGRGRYTWKSYNSKRQGFIWFFVRYPYKTFRPSRLHEQNISVWAEHQDRPTRWSVLPCLNNRKIHQVIATSAGDLPLTWGWNPLPPCVLRTALFWPCVLRTAIFGLAYCVPFNNKNYHFLAFPFTQWR